MEFYQLEREGYLLSTDKQLLDFDVIHDFLSTSYWSPDIPRETVVRAAENSVTFGLFRNGIQVGYARVISDQTTFAYLADVFVAEDERGKGLSKWMIETILAAPFLQGLRRWMLATRDAHGLYCQYGFKRLEEPEMFMQVSRPDIYQESQIKQ